MDPVLGHDFYLSRSQMLVIGVGLVPIGIGLLIPKPARSRVLRAGAKVCTAVLSLLLVASVTEASFRLLDIRVGPDPEETPVYFRMPSEPVCEAAFRRRGHEEWTGEVINAGFRASGGEGEAMPNETAVTVSYDGDGFRNPPDLTDWDIAVIGDSFVELGYLPYEELFTTRLASNLGKRVRNLGVSSTGPMTYLCYLESFGRSPSTRHAVLAFFEGNDLEDLEQELDARELYRLTGEREDRNPGPLDSPLRVAWQLLHPRPKGWWLEPNAEVNANGSVQAVTVNYAPQSWKDVEPDVQRGLESILATWAEESTRHGITPWFLYIPCKHRVYFDSLSMNEDAEPWLRDWEPTDLPIAMQRLCERHGIAFVDVTKALTESLTEGQLVFSNVWDTHLNPLGSAIVADVLAASMAPRLEQP